jgi:hypothetical protein
MQPLKLFALIAFIVAGVVSLLLWFGKTSEAQWSTDLSGRDRLHGSQVSASALGKGARDVSPIGQVENRSVMDVDLATSRNLRKFVEDAKRNPSLGTGYLAFKAVQTCKSTKSLWADQQKFEERIKAPEFPNKAAAMEAQALLAERCQGFTSQDLEKPDLDFAVSDEVFKAYKRLSEMNGQATPFGDKSLDLKLLVEYANGFLNPKLFASSANSQAKVFDPAIYFDGRNFGGVSEEAFNRAFLAWELSIGLEEVQAGFPQASQRSIASIIVCASDGRCGRNPVEQAIQDLPQNSNVRAEVAWLFPRLSNDLRSGNIEAFAPPKS